MTVKDVFRREFVRLLCLVGIIAGTAYVGTSFVVGRFVVESVSMMPTLAPGEVMLVNKVPFGARLRSHYWLRWGVPQRNEIVLFEGSESGLPNGIYVKRIVAVGGDTVFMTAGTLSVFGGSGPGVDPINGSLASTADKAIDGYDWQKIRALVTSRFVAAPVQPTRDKWGPLVVPADSVFVLGDNRAHSVDSREFGFLAIRELIGTPLITWKVH